MAEKHPEWSPYNYVLDNPLALIDPDGRQVSAQSATQFGLGMASGAWSGVKGTVSGLANAVMHPIQTAMGLSELTTPYGQTMAAIAIGEAVGERVDKLQSRDPRLMGEVTGEALVAVVEAVVGSKGAGALAKATKAARAGDATAGLAKGASLIPDDFVVVRGGETALPVPGTTFSGAAGRTLDDAAAGVPHGKVRATTAGKIRAGGGSVVGKPELTRSGVLNEKHVNICVGGGSCPFGPLQPNPVPKSGRIHD